MENILEKPISSFYLQWHITQCCNLRCKHCYQPGYNKNSEFSLVEMAQAFIQYKELVDFFNKDIQNDDEIIAPILSFTGGEPFLHEDFLELLEIVSSNIPAVSVCILSNGTLITPDIAQKLSSLKIERVQISIDGDEETHDSIRGKGAFLSALKGIENLVDNQIDVSVSFTAHKNNYKLFPKVVQIAKDVNARMVWTDRLIPNGSGAELLMMDKEETKEYISLIGECAKKIESDKSSYLEVGKHRALQFLSGHKDVYRCSAGISGLTLMHNGDVYPCRRMPIKIGNIKNQTLKEIYFKSPVLKDLRQPQTAEGCSSCEHKDTCLGGLKCLSYAVYSDLNKADPGCWLAVK